jgi:hypothetical protein
MATASLLRPTRKADAKQLQDLVAEAEGFKESAEESAGVATAQAGLSTTKAGEAALSEAAALGYLTQTETARDEAVLIVYGGGYNTTPTPGNVPIAGSTGTLDKGWVAAEYSVQLIEHINYVLDVVEVVRKDVPSNRSMDSLVQMLLQISDLAGQAAKTLSGVGEYKASPGSATRCAIAHRANPGTGIYFPAANEIAFAVNGVQVLRLDSSGIVP